MSFKEELQKRTGEIEEIIKEYLPEETGFQRTVLEAMNYSVLAGGKRLRPMLMQETFRMFGGRKAGSSIHGCYRDDPYLFSGPRRSSCHG